jgi:UDP-N-acetylglucosamine 2-epimerase (non-hydrolysing)
MQMPEEINRIVTDSIADLLFTTDPKGNENLLHEGVAQENIHFVGNVMIDTLIQNRTPAAASTILEELKVKPREYCLLTMHRPSNVDNKEVLSNLLKAFDYIQNRIKIIYPAHPRAMKMIKKLKLSSRLKKMKKILYCEPLNYHQLLKLNENARFVITDSGGIQEETTVLGIPCITIRENTERPVTVSTGTNEVVGTHTQAIKQAVDRILAGNWKKGGIPRGWDGKAAIRIVKVIEEFLL